MLASSDGRARVTVVSFDGEDHIEFCRRIIEPFNGRQELIDHTGLASKRRDDAVHRPFLVRRNGERSRCRWIPRRHRVCDNPNAERYWQHYKNGKHDHARCRAHGGQSQYAEQKRDCVGDFVQRSRRKLWPRGLKLLGRANSGRDQHVVYSVPERSCTPPNADFHPPPNAHNFLEYDSDDTTDRRVDQKEDHKEGGVRLCRDGPVQRPVLEGAAMSDFMSHYLVPAAIIAVAVVLLLGLINMMRGGSPNRSQKLMRLRVLLQFVAIIVIMATIWAMGR